MRVVVTGAAGFIASHLADRLLAEGHHVLGVDALTPYYDPDVKRANLASAFTHPAFEFVEADLRVRDLRPFMDAVDVVFHQAAQPGVRSSWDGFSLYSEHNVLGTQRVLEAAAGANVSRVVYASSSSIYGNAARYPTFEDDLPRPHSPYGVTKLAGEHLCGAYAENFALDTVVLRYFTVYGPRQRPDMAMHRLIEATLSGDTFPLYGDGTQVRDFTYVDDVVAANLRAATAAVDAGTVLNVAGGSSITMNGLFELVGELTSQEVPLVRFPAQAGDVTRTGGSIERIGALLGWHPETDLRAGLSAQIAWQRARRQG